MNDRRDDVPRHVLPIPDQKPVGVTTYDAKDPDTRFPPIRPLRPPAGAPNVLIVLLDDVGFGASSAFGGPCHTPTAERLATQGLKYIRFHTTALCSPTRAAMLSGRNHHAVGMGAITEVAKLPSPINDQVGSLPFTHRPALTLALTQSGDGTWNHSMLGVPSSRAEHFEGVGTISAVRRLLEYGWDKDTPPLVLARRVLFRLLAGDEDPEWLFEFGGNNSAALITESDGRIQSTETRARIRILPYLGID